MRTKWDRNVSRLSLRPALLLILSFLGCCLPSLSGTHPLFAQSGTFPDSVEAEVEGGPTIISNGGDLVRCGPPHAKSGHDKKGQVAAGFYALDFLTNYSGTRLDYLEGESADGFERQLQAWFDRVDPDLAYYFRRFSQSREQAFGADEGVIWVDALFPPADLMDESIEAELPENCRARGSDRLELIQAIVQTRYPDLIEFFQDASMVDRLEREAPLQYSFLMLHEFLWRFVGNARSIAKLNHLFHLKATHALPTDKAASLLQRYGLEARPQSFLPICRRTRPLREAIERLFGRPCGEVAVKELAEAEPDLDLFSDVPVSDFFFDQFNGFRRVRSLNLSNLGLRHLNAKQFLFMKVEAIDLSGNSLKSLQAETFQGLGLKYLDLSDYSLEALPRGLSEAFRKDIRVRMDVRGNPGLSFSLTEFCAGFQDGTVEIMADAETMAHAVGRQETYCYFLP